jgi:hypothetical protein
MADDAQSPVKTFVARAEAVLGGRLDAIYAFGSEFGRGEKAPDANLLVLVQAMDRPLLDAACALAVEARERRIGMRIETTNDIVRGADVFPIFVLELLDTKALLSGRDVLADLAVDRSQLRLRAEQSLRVLRRDLLQSYLDAVGDQRLAVELRRSVRKAVYLLRAIALVVGIELPQPPNVETTVETVLARLLPGERDVWHRLRRFAGFEEALQHDALVGLYCAALASLSALTDAVDRL